jgi:putative phosphoesterase
VRFAVIADIHGNRWALETVLSDIERRRVDAVINLGDHLYGPLDMRGTMDLLLNLNAISIRGNQDRELLEDPKDSDSRTLKENRAELRSQDLAWLRELPMTTVWKNILACHGSPQADNVYLLEQVTAHGVFLKSAAQIEHDLDGEEHDMILCGHSHLPRTVQAGKRVVINPGSVGLPAYTDDQPFPHRMETGSPHARYAIVDGPEIDHIQLKYDWEAASRTALTNGREDWAYALRTGRAASP